MGFFSWACPVCHKSVLSSYALKSDVDPRWAEATLVTPSLTATGTYDGYGRLCGDSGLEIEVPHEKAKLYHADCYDLVGRPSFATAEESGWAKDQGYFINPQDYSGTPLGVSEC